MNTIKYLLLLVAVAFGFVGNIFGQATVAFNCSEVGIIVTQSGIPTATRSTFSKLTIDNSTTPGTNVVTPLFSIPYNINATAYNPQDGFLYSFEIGSLTRFFRIDANGDYDVLTAVAPGTAPAGNAYKGAAINDSGLFYLIANGASDTGIFYIDLNAPNGAGNYPTTRMGLGGGQTGIPDIVWNSANNTLYGIEAGVSAQYGKVCVIELAVNGKSVTSFTRIGTAVASRYSFGGVYIDYSGGNANGTMNGTLNDDNSVYRFDLTTGARTQLTGSWTTGQGSTPINDGASCPALWADISVTKDDAITSMSPGDATAYTIVVSNAGPTGASGVQVSDLLPAGIPAANVSYTAAVAGGAATLVTGTQTGAIDDTVSLPVGASVTYTLTLRVPANFAGNTLENTVTAMPPATIFDPDLTNNTATDINTILRADVFIPVNPHVRGTTLK